MAFLRQRLQVVRLGWRRRTLAQRSMRRWQLGAKRVLRLKQLKQVRQDRLRRSYRQLRKRREQLRKRREDHIKAFRERLRRMR